MRRDGAGRANGTGTTSRLWYLGVSASRGSTDTPRPDATMLRTVSSELRARHLRLGAVQLRAGVEHLVAEAVADVEQDRVLGGELVRRGSTCASPTCGPRGTTTWNGSSYRNSVTTPGGANGSAMIAASMRPRLQRGLEVLGQVLLDVERHLRRELVQRRDEVGQQVRRDRVDDAELAARRRAGCGPPARSP